MKILFGEVAGVYQEKSEAIRSVIDRVVTSANFSGVLDFDAVRAEGGASETEWPDGYVHQAAKDMGLTVEL